MLFKHFVKKMDTPWLYGALRIGLAFLFIYGGGSKLLHPKVFTVTISSYDLVPEALLPVLAIGLPLIETLAGLALIFDLAWGLHGIAALLVMFVFVLGYGIAGDLNVDCGCFGVEELNKQSGLWLAFYRDLVLLGLVVPYLYLSGYRKRGGNIFKRIFGRPFATVETYYKEREKE
ncbi:MAG: hypothetical protein CSYNP_01772 [Syntrophus sp. SKADARSKE-3]|nr:hypothetical protein [Syntrophus sp. SKADARSKE-3]